MLRLWRGKLSQRDVAPILGLTQAAVSNLESGDVTPKLETAFQIEEKTGGAVPAKSWREPAPETPSHG